MMTSLSNLGLKRKLFIFYSMLIMATLTLSCLIYFNCVRSIIYKNGITYTSSILEQVKTNIEVNLEQIERTSLFISTNSLLHGYLSNMKYKGFDPYFREQFSNSMLLVDSLFTSKNITSIYVFDMFGGYIGTDVISDASVYQKYIPMAIEKDGLIECVVEDGQDDTMLVLRAIFNSNVKPVGMLVIKTRLNLIRELAESKLSDIDGKLFILDKNDRIVSCDDNQMTGETFYLEKPKQVAQNLQSYDITELDGRSYLISKYLSSYNDWKYICMVPMSTITDDEAYIIKDLAIIAAMCTLLAGFFTYIIANSITSPLLMLTNKLRNIEIDFKDMINYSAKDEFSYLFSAYNAMQDRIHYLINQAYEERMLRNEMEIKALQMQINPHFLFNTLELIKCIALDRKVNEISEIVTSFGEMMRYCLIFDSTNSMLSTLGGEVTHIVNYCNIQKLHLSKSVHFFFDITSDIEHVKIPRLTLQPIMENAFIHGIGMLKPDEIGVIELTAVRVNDGVRIKITNSGPSIDDIMIDGIFEKSKSIKFGQQHGIGIANVIARINILFGEPYGVKIYRDENNCTTFEILVPYEDKDALKATEGGKE